MWNQFQRERRRYGDYVVVVLMIICAGGSKKMKDMLKSGIQSPAEIQKKVLLNCFQSNFNRQFM